MVKQGAGGGGRIFSGAAKQANVTVNLLRQVALEEAEGALQAEESKVLRAQLEVTQIRNDITKRIQEKEEEFDNTR